MYCEAACKPISTPGTGSYAVGSSEALMERARAGCRQAAEALIAEHYPSMARVAFRYCGTWDDAQDITQEASLKAFRSFGSFRGESQLATWLYRITVNASCDWIKRRRRSGRLREEFLEHLRLEKQSKPVDGEALTEALKQLSSSEQESIRLTYFEGCTHEEAGRHLNCAESTVSWKLHRARKKLRQLLAQR